MANSPQAKKRAKQAEKSRQLNASQRSAMRTRVKKVTYAIAEGDKEKAAEAFKACAPTLDQLAGKGLIHKNKAARQKSRMNAAIKAL